MNTQKDQGTLATVNAIIVDYMKKDSVDYALMLTGEWGSGKTFYCNSILQDTLMCCIDEKKRYVVPISLFGRKHLDRVLSEITIKAIGVEKGYSFFDRLFVDDAASIVGDATSKPWISSVFSYFGKVLNKSLPEIVKGIDLDLRRQVLIVFDDLERCEEKDLKYLMGQIQRDFIDNGYHVLFLSNEKEIKWEEYARWKEKFIRTTIQFSQFLEEVLPSIICARSSSYIKELYNEDKDRFSSLINMVSSIQNIRTWMFAFDIYDKVYLDASLTKSNPYRHNLFLIILLTCYYNSIDSKLFDAEFSFSAEDNKTPSVEKSVQEDFHIESESLPGFNGREWTLRLRMNSDGYVFVKMKSILSIIQRGYMNVSQFKEEFETSFPYGNQYEIEYSRLADFLSLSEQEFKNTVNTVLDGIKQDKYKWYQYLNIAVYLQDFDNNGYLTLVDSKDYKTIIIDAVKRINPSTIGLDEMQRSSQAVPEFLKPAIEAIIESIKNNDLEKGEFLSFFDLVEREAVFDIHSYFAELFFERVVKYEMINRLIVFDGKSLNAIERYLYHITRSDKCGQFYQNQIVPIKQIESTISSYLNDTIDQSKHYYDLKFFNKMLQQAIKKLEITANNKD